MILFAVKSQLWWVLNILLYLFYEKTTCENDERGIEPTLLNAFKNVGWRKYRDRTMLVEGFAATDTAKVNAERANLALRIYRDGVRGLIWCRT